MLMAASHLVIYGLLFCTTGALLLMHWKRFIQNLINADNSKRSKLHMAPKPEKAYWLIGGAIVKIVGVMSLLVGALMILSAVTGFEWPIQY
jgi:amino acid transporter